MKQKIFTITDWVHSILSSYVEEGAVCVDATAGKGKDTVFLSKLVGEQGKVVAFDVQKAAIEQAQTAVREAGCENRVQFVLDGHENMDCYVEEGAASVILFNLGYLPGGDHSIGTKKETTLLAAKKALSCLKKEGMLCIVIYSGGDTGFEEKDAVLSWAESLPAREYDVIGCPFLNKPNNPPMPVFVRKR